MIDRKKHPKVIRNGAFYLFIADNIGLHAFKDGKPFYDITVPDIESYGVYMNSIGFFTAILTNNYLIIFFSTLNETRQLKIYNRTEEIIFIRESPDGFMLSETVEFRISDFIFKRHQNEVLSSRFGFIDFQSSTDFDRYQVTAPNNYSFAIYDHKKLIATVDVPAAYSDFYTNEEFIILLSDEGYFCLTIANILLGEEMELKTLENLLKSSKSADKDYAWNTNSVENIVLPVDDLPLQILESYVIYPYFIFDLEQQNLINTFKTTLSASMTCHGLLLSTVDGLAFLDSTISLPLPRSLPKTLIFSNGEFTFSETDLTIDLWLAQKIDLYEARSALNFSQTATILRSLTLKAPDFLHYLRDLLNCASMAELFLAVIRSLDEPEVEIFFEKLGISRFALKNLLSKDQQNLLPHSQCS